MSTLPVIEANGLTVEFRGRCPLFRRTPTASVQALSDVSISIDRGETVAVVGESGCGKSTLGRALLRSAPITRGKVTFQGQDITALEGEALGKCGGISR